MPASEAVTEGIRVSVETRYSPSRSVPGVRWFFVYTVTIRNEGRAPVQLVSRHWIITDATGEVSEVRGEGVVGKQPVIAPGESYTYTSGCPLPTPFGSMEGSYRLTGLSGREDRPFDARIAPFELRAGEAIH